MFKKIILVFFIFFISGINSKRDYKIKQSNVKLFISDNIKFLQKISKAKNEIAQYGAKGTVLIYKTKNVIVNNNPFGSISPFGDPFEEFFFGPFLEKRRNFGKRDKPRKEKRQISSGSGFIIDLDLGYIVTNNHVVESKDINSEEIMVKLPNKSEYKAKFIAGDEKTDIALLQIEDKNFNKNGLIQLSLANSNDIQVGEIVMAIGSPFGFYNTVTDGIISAKNRYDIGGVGSKLLLSSFIQTNASINPGNSGGPMLNTKGEVIGMNTAIATPSRGSVGLGFAIPSYFIKIVVERLINFGKFERGFVGIGIQDNINGQIYKTGISKYKRNADKNSNIGGAMVTSIMKGSPAEGKLEIGDVILKINDTVIENQAVLSNTIAVILPGKSVRFEFIRGSKIISKYIKIGREKEVIASSKGGKYVYGLNLKQQKDGGIEIVDIVDPDKYYLSSNISYFVVGDIILNYYSNKRWINANNLEKFIKVLENAKKDNLTLPIHIQRKSGNPVIGTIRLK